MERVSFLCNCGQKLIASRDKIGHQFRCPKCSEDVSVPFDEVSVSKDLKPPSLTDRMIDYLCSQGPLWWKETRAAMWDAGPATIAVGRFVLVAFLLVMPLSLWFEPSRHAWFWGNCIVAILPLSLFLLFRGKHTTRWTVALYLSLGVAMAIVYHRKATYKEYWNSDGFRVVDTHRRNGDIVYRSVSGSTAGKDYVSIEGPMTASNKRHGEWSVFTTSGGTTTEYYWYGEEVSEGDWHRLSGQ